MPASRRSAVLALLAAATLLASVAGAAAGAKPPSPPTPHLGLSWNVVRFTCWTATESVRVRRGRRVRVEKRHVRRCGNRPFRVHSRALHLAWRQHGELFGHLTLAGKPIAGAGITINWTILGWGSGSESVVTDAQGRFSELMFGPNRIITVSYSPAGGQLIAATHQIDASTHLSLHVGQLTAGRDASFWGIVYGGYLPQSLYVQFWYLTYNGWQPFSHLAFVTQSNGHWFARVPIPQDAAGYTYEIRASVVPSPYWPWSATSGVLSRFVSY